MSGCWVNTSGYIIKGVVVLSVVIVVVVGVCTDVVVVILSGTIVSYNDGLFSLSSKVDISSAGSTSPSNVSAALVFASSIV